MRRVLSAVGRTLVTVGILLLLFVAYQLWGTGLYQARAQDDLRDRFEQKVQQAPEPAPAAESPPLPADGQPVATLEIPRIGVSQVVVEGVSIDDLREGPGHYPTTPLPGQQGNAAIAGHRTTYGAPFADIDQLSTGDEIRVRTTQGSFTYRVDARGPFVVDPTDVSVLDPVLDETKGGAPRATLTLTTCHPKYSAAERMIVRADLVLPSGAQPLPPAAGIADREGLTTIDAVSGDDSARGPTILWAIITLLIGLAWWFWFHRYPRWTTWIVGAVPFLASLFVTYTYLERLLPANY